MAELWGEKVFTSKNRQGEDGEGRNCCTGKEAQEGDKGPKCWHTEGGEKQLKAKYKEVKAMKIEGT